MGAGPVVGAGPAQGAAGFAAWASFVEQASEVYAGAPDALPPTYACAGEVMINRCALWQASPALISLGDGKMGLEVYFREDIVKALLAAEQATGEAMRASGGGDGYGEGYWDGYRAALTTLALAFGLVRVGGMRATAWLPVESRRDGRVRV